MDMSLPTIWTNWSRRKSVSKKILCNHNYGICWISNRLTTHVLHWMITCATTAWRISSLKVSWDSVWRSSRRCQRTCKALKWQSNDYFPCRRPSLAKCGRFLITPSTMTAPTRPKHCPYTMTIRTSMMQPGCRYSIASAILAPEATLCSPMDFSLPKICAKKIQMHMDTCAKQMFRQNTSKKEGITSTWDLLSNWARRMDDQNKFGKSISANRISWFQFMGISFFVFQF